MATWGSPITLRGPKGDTGEAGSRSYRTAAAPTDATASSRPGDTAVDDAGIYYVRTADGWPATGLDLRGRMGISGVDSGLYVGANAPDPALGRGEDALYVRANGQVYLRQSTDAGWTDTKQNLTGPVGADGLRGTQIYFGEGPPSTDLGSFSPPAMPGDPYFDIAEANPKRPELYILQA